MKQTKYNWSGSSRRSKLAFESVMKEERSKPTYKQIEYYNNLIEQMKAVGIKWRSKRPKTRKEYSHQLKKMNSVLHAELDKRK